MDMAQRIEDKNQTIWEPRPPWTPVPLQARSLAMGLERKGGHNLNTRETTLIERTTSPHPEKQIRRLSHEEMQQKREKGLCFRCDEKFSPGHRCGSRELQVLVLNEGYCGKGEEGEPEEELNLMSAKEIEECKLSEARRESILSRFSP